MRRKDRAITESEARSLLRKAEYGVLSTVSGDGNPYGVPLSFCVIDDGIYFHCAVEGLLSPKLFELICPRKSGFGK